MAAINYILIIGVFLFYYFLVFIFEKKVIQDPREIIEKFFAVALVYAGISLIYFSFTGKPFLTDDVSEYYVYIFIIGFISVLWAIPNLLSEFRFFRRFSRKAKKNK
jgi:hypothetical protein